MLPHDLLYDGESQTSAFLFRCAEKLKDIHPRPQELQKALEKHLDQENVFFVDVTPALSDAAGKQGVERLKAGGVDVHPSEVAHEVIAETIAPVLDLALQTVR